MNKRAILYTIFAAVGVTLLLIVMVSSCHTGNDPNSTDDLREDISWLQTAPAQVMPAQAAPAFSAG
jgi:hypothetical protein